MTKEVLVQLLKTDVEAWNRLRLERAVASSPLNPPTDELDLRGADLSGAEIPRANLSGVNLQGAILDRAHLSMADLANADLTGASLVRTVLINAELAYCVLTGANLERADLGSADLSLAFLAGARLVQADLRYATLERTVLTGADLSGATISGTTFADMDLRRVNGLESTRHLRPSTLGVDTIYRSKGEIPESFLRSVGVPEGLIFQIPALIGAQGGILFHSCFISYSHQDEAFAQRLHERMRAAKLRVWYAPEDVKGGRKLHEQIETQIQVQDKLLLILSEASMRSEWVAHEIYTARRREIRDKRQILFPISLCPFEEIARWKSFDADSGKDMAREVREYFIPDFSHWKEYDRFERAFKRLLSDLEAGATTRRP